VRKSSFRTRKNKQFCRLGEEGGGEDRVEDREDKKIEIEY